MARTASLKPGDRIDRFRVVELLGVGGMGEVYLATDTRDARPVALKTLSKDHVDFDHLRELFTAEVELTRRLAHPNVVNFVARGESPGFDWVALEYIDGTSLETRLRDGGAPPLPTALSWWRDLAFALHAAHQQRILHRDIKPDNVMITSSGTVKLIDFGLACRAHRTEGARGERVGTLAYMAPECFQGHGADERSDLYALGLVAYELFTGERLVEDVGLASAILEAHEEADELGPFVPGARSPLVEAVEAIVRTLLRRHPEERLASTHELVARLEELNVADASTDSNEAGKRMAQAELADTHYWQAKNLLADEKVDEAIDELLRIRTFIRILDDRVRSNLLSEIELLLLRLEPRSAVGEETPYRIHAPARHGERLVELVELYGLLAPADLRRLKLRLVLRRLEAILDEGELHRISERLLAAFPESIPVTRLFLRGMTRRFPGAARGVSLEFARSLLQRGELHEAERTLDEHERLFGKDDDWIRTRKELILLQAQFQDDEADALEHYAASRPTRSSAYCEDICLRFLASHAPSAHLLQALASSRRRERRHGELVEILVVLGSLRFFQGRKDAAKAAFVEALAHDGRHRGALAYLVEMVDEERGFSPPPASHQDLRLAIFRALGVYELERDELARRLTGTGADLDLLERLEKRARAVRAERDFVRWRFERARLLVAANRIDDAREILVQVLEDGTNGVEATKALAAHPELQRLCPPDLLLRLARRIPAEDETDWLADLRDRASDRSS